MTRMTEYPKNRLEDHDKHLMGPQGFWYQLMHDEELKDKLEDSKPFNTFVELLLWGIFILTILGFIMDLVVNYITIRQLLRIG